MEISEKPNLCYYCQVGEESTENPLLTCENCDCNIHISCLKTSGGLPTCLLGDVFFKLFCENCNQRELILREKMSWLAIVVLVLYNLHKQSQSSSRKGFFHWKIHICKFIQDNWKLLFLPNTKRKKTWTGTVSGTLTHCPTVFQSGTDDLGEPGWWRLYFPDVLPLQTVQIKAQTLKRYSSKLNEAIKAEDDQSSLGSGSESMMEFDKVTIIKQEPSWSVSSDSSEMYSRAYVEPSATLSDILFDDEEVDVELDLDGDPQFIQMSNQHVLPEAVEMVHSTSSSFLTGDPVMDRSSKEEFLNTYNIKREMDETSNDDTNTQDTEEGSNKNMCQPMSEFEEVQLMHRLQRAGPIPDAASRRLLRKLTVRHRKRQNNLPLFNIDLNPTGYTDRDPSVSRFTNSGHERVLDRFQNPNGYTASVSKLNTPFLLRLMGCCEPTPFYSPYTERLLKPYIMRESSSRAPWIKLMSELMIKAHKNDKSWKLPEPASLDYSYVRPQHIATVNSLCREYFWPGVDLTESLQYPDFTCVALYKKLIVGFAFLVPDVNYNETYISFLFIRPEWRRAGIASFMLYHLIQTCMGKDVTLHVSATNSALILYQKFGFKVEEFVQDFYEKYIPVESKECRHALFLRLSR